MCRTPPWYWNLAMISYDMFIYHNSLGILSIWCWKNMKKQGSAQGSAQGLIMEGSAQLFYHLLDMISHDMFIYHNSLGILSIWCWKNIKKQGSAQGSAQGLIMEGSAQLFNHLLDMISHDMFIYHTSLGILSIWCWKNIKKQGSAQGSARVRHEFGMMRSKCAEPPHDIESWPWYDMICSYIILLWAYYPFDVEKT